MERVETIADVRTKDLPTGVTLYLLKDSEGREYSTRNRDLARVAEAARTAMQHVHLDYDEKKNDRGFTNRFLNSIVPVEDGDTPPLFGEAPTGLFDDAEPEAIATSQLDQKDLQIAKAVGLKAGVDVLQHLPAEQRTVANVVTAAEFFTRWLTSWRP